MLNETNVQKTRDFYDNIGHVSWSTATIQHYHVGIFENKKDTMDDAQKKTVEYMERKLALSDTDLVLDLGCGSGLSAIEISKRTKCRIVGINISDKQIEIGNELIRQSHLAHQVKLLNMDAHNLIFKPNIFDSAYALESIMHMNRETVLKQVRNVLKPGGLFTLCDWFINKPLTQAEKDFLERITCGHYITKDEYDLLFHKFDYTEVEIDDWTNKVYPTYKFWTTVTDEMRQNIPEKILRDIEKNCQILSEISIEKLGYLQITAQNGDKNEVF